MNHSPEPWKTEAKQHFGTYDDYTALTDSGGSEVFEVVNENMTDGSYVIALDEDLERIVACVNACQGIPTEELSGLQEKLESSARAVEIAICQHYYELERGRLSADPSYVGFSEDLIKRFESICDPDLVEKLKAAGIKEAQ